MFFIKVVLNNKLLISIELILTRLLRQIQFGGHIYNKFYIVKNITNIRDITNKAKILNITNMINITHVINIQDITNIRDIHNKINITSKSAMINM